MTCRDDFHGSDSSDVTLNEIEVFLGAKPIDWGSTPIQWPYEHGGTGKDGHTAVLKLTGDF